MDTMGCPARRVCSSSIQARFGAGCLCRAASSMLKQLHSSVTHLAEPAAKRTRTQAGPCPTTCSASGRDLPVRHALHVCVNKTCKRQGSKEVAQFAEDLALEELEVHTTGCLGRCGNGPNLVLEARGEAGSELALSHVSTPAKLAEALRAFTPLDVSEGLLKATECRLAGNVEARGGNLARAVELYTAGLEAASQRGRHLLLANRAGARLALGDAAGAAADADEAAALAPPGFTTCYIRQVEARARLGHCRAAEQALAQAARREPAFSRSPEFKSMKQQLQRMLQQQGACVA